MLVKFLIESPVRVREELTTWWRKSLKEHHEAVMEAFFGGHDSSLN